MKIIDGFEFICVDDRMIAVSTGDANTAYTGVIDLNKTAYKIWKYIEEGINPDEIASRLSTEYEGLSIDDAKRSVQKCVDELIEKGILIED